MRTRRSITRVALLAAGALCLASAAHAVTFVKGDLFASVSNGQVQHWRDVGGTWTLLDTYADGKSGFTTGSALDKSGNLYVTNFSASTIAKYDNTGTLVNANFALGDAGSATESIVFDKDGNFYVGQASGTRDILKFDSSGTLLDRYDVATEIVGSDWIDLASDQKTMYYTSEGTTIKRYDVSTKTQLADFATGLSGSNAFALRLLGDGGLLVADRQEIKRLDNTGSEVWATDYSGQDNWFALNLDPDGKTFWSGDFGTGELHQFSIATGTHLATIDTGVGGGRLYGVSLFGEITQGGGGNVIPEPGTLILLGTGLLGVSGRCRRRTKAKS